MKIISLNTWAGQQEKELADYLQETMKETDIFLLQEASEKAESLRAAILQEWLSVSARKFEARYNEEIYQTTIFRPEISLVSSGTFCAHNSNQGLGLWTELMVNNERYVFCNIHGVSTPSEKVDTEDRIAQSQEILNFLRERPGKHIIMGDFNLFPDTKSVALFEEAGYRNLISEYKIDTTRNEFAWALYPNNKHLFADYTFVSPDIKVVDFQVPKNEVSDHLPMELTIE